MRRGEPSLLTAIADVLTGNAPLTDAKFESLNDPLKRRVETVFKGLKQRGDIPENSKIGDKAVLQQVVNYMESFTDETTQPKIIKEKDIKSATEKGNIIIAQARRREFYDMKSGKTYTYDDMIKAKKLTGDVKEDQSNTTYRGQITSDNRISTTLP